MIKATPLLPPASMIKATVVSLATYAAAGCSGGANDTGLTGGSGASEGSLGAHASAGASSAAAPSSPDGSPREPAACSLSTSGALTTTSNGQVIENLWVSATSGNAITIKHDDVTLRNVYVEHGGGRGIYVDGADDVTMVDVHVVYTGGPASGQNPSSTYNNVECSDSNRLRVDRAKLERGSSGIYLVDCDDSHLSSLEGHDFRGPFPRGQLVQWNRSDRGVLEDFSAENPAATSWVEDNISVYDSNEAVIRRGLLDGNNSPSGVGVMVEFDHEGETALIEEVDAVRMGNGCFSGYSAVGGGPTFQRTRCRENICTDQGRGAPLSGGQGWVAGETAQVTVTDSLYYDMCSGISWASEDTGAAFVELDRTHQDYPQRSPLRLGFCWE